MVTFAPGASTSVFASNHMSNPLVGGPGEGLPLEDDDGLPDDEDDSLELLLDRLELIEDERLLEMRDEDDDGLPLLLDDGEPLELLEDDGLPDDDEEEEGGLPPNIPKRPART